MVIGNDSDINKKGIEVGMALPIIENTLPYLEGLKSIKMTQQLILYLNQKAESEVVTGIKKDEWNNIIDFLFTINDNVNNFSEDDCWPVLFDNFIEHHKS